MRPLTAIALIGAGIFVLSKIATANIASRLNFVLGGVSASLSGLTPVVTVNVVVQNPTSGSFTVNSLVGNISVNGTQIGNISMFVATVIPPNNQVQLPLTVILNPAQVLTDLLNLLTGNSGNQVIVSLDGTANIDNIPIPVSIQYNVL
jgi:LEA14-like dessication related protein